MTTIRYFEDGGCCYLHVGGHADYSHSGMDIVCSAVSMLACTMAACLEDEERRGNLKRMESDLRGGEVNLEWEPEDFAAGRLRTIWETVETGFSLLAEHYPANVEWEE